MAKAKLLAEELAGIARMIKDEFFTGFDADASIGDVMDNLDAFSPRSRSIIKALDKDDWLGFDNPVEAIDTALSEQINNFEASSPLKASITKAANQASIPQPRRIPAPVGGIRGAAGLLEPFSGKSAPVAHNFGTGSASSSKTGAKGTYGLYADAYRQAAEQAGVLPRQMQSIAWENVRGLFPAGFKTKENAAAVSAIQNDYLRGKLTQDQARSRVVDLAGGIETPSWYNPSRDVRDIKSTADSSFKPSLTSKGLLAGGGAAGAGGAMASPGMEKYTDPTQRTQLAPRAQMMQSPENPFAAGVSNAMEYANQGMRSIDPTGGLLAPELPADFFRKQAYGEKRGIMDYILGAAGML